MVPPAPFPWVYGRILRGASPSPQTFKKLRAVPELECITAR